MSYNTPDDWGNYYSNCENCKQRTHASEGHMCPCDEAMYELETEFEALVAEIQEAGKQGDWAVARLKSEDLEVLCAQLALTKFSRDF
jgi:hypothetical protein